MLSILKYSTRFCKTIFARSIELKNDVVFFWHLFFAFIFYSNYFLFNRPLIASTDPINLNFPILIKAKFDFLNGELGLWNPYLLSGVSAFSTSNAPIFSPDNWILFLLPMKYFFLGGTFLSFIKMWLVGVFSYLIFLEELENKKWAFFTSLIYVLSGYTIWATMIFDVLSLYLFTTISLYLIWTFHRRSQYTNYIFLTVALLANMLSSNIAYTSYSLIVIVVGGLYRFLSNHKSLFSVRHYITFILALVTSITLHLFRLIPVWAETHDSNRPFDFTLDFRDTSFLGLRLFNPELFGICYRNSFGIIENLGSQFAGVHIQWAMPVFFGVLPALLVVWAIISPQIGRINFWTVYVVITVPLVLFMEPFETIFKLLNPVYHTLSMQIFLPLGFSMLAGYSAMNLEKEIPKFSISQKLWMMIILILGIIVLYQGAVGVANLQDSISFLRIAILGILLLGLIGFLIFCRWPEAGFMFSSLVFLIALGLLIFLVLFAKYPNPTFTSHLKILSVSLVALIFILIFLWNRSYGNIKETKIRILAGILILLFLWVLLYPWTGEVRMLPSTKQSLLLALMGFGRFFLISLIFIFVLKLAQLKQFKAKWLFPLFLAIFIAEQVPAGKIHSHIVVNPFYKYSHPYPPRTAFIDEQGQLINLDLKNYRVNFPNTMLNIPLYIELYSPYHEIMSSINAAYQIRSYGGHYNVVSARYSKFIKEIVPELKAGEIGFGVYQRITNDRFLDLVGVKYHYDVKSKAIMTRPNAISRFMFFQNFQVIDNANDALSTLSAPGFQPLKTLILNKDPGFGPASTTARAQKLEPVHSSMDVIELIIYTDVSGIIAFNDSFHAGWNAYLNEKKQDVLYGNFNFMAVPVPAGENRLVFRFEPEHFHFGLKMGGLGLTLFFFSCFSLFLFRKNIDGGQNSASP